MEETRQFKDSSLAPRSWDSYIGQDKIKSRLQIQIQGALNRFENLKHTLILGPPGYGKTTLAELVASEMHQDLLMMMMTPNFKIENINKRLEKLEDPTIVFLDEIHNLDKKSQHYLFDVMEKNRLTYDNGKYHYLEVPVTILSATTEQDKIVKPLYDRFHNKHFLDDYSEEEMAQIIHRMCYKINIQPTRDFCLAMGKASCGVPRQARALVFAAQDLGTLDVEPILNLTGYTPEGLTEDHMSYLSTLDELSAGGSAVGIKNIVTHSQRPAGIVEEVEKVLIKKQFITIAKNGRSLTYQGQQALKRNKERL